MTEEIPEGLPEAVDEAALRRARAVATLLDESVEIPGTNYKVGLDPILSVLPVSGDLVGGALSMYIVAEAARLGVPYTTIVRMLATVGVDVVIGSVPVVGTAFDAVWKANKWNVELLERHLEEARERAEREGRTIEVAEIDELESEVEGIEDAVEDEGVDETEQAERLEEVEAAEGMEETETREDLSESGDSEATDDSEMPGDSDAADSDDDASDST
ncbi:DUF4112 domain-containing protein [Halegenticoccus tardaugens]|uniref:DUF4112 domain-containing protein n=1 Tax=Halegenticoccus tardaugens TaxID=2071624 RepID=UPI001E5E2E40|nr:DUF4112 domain-containing protein [Halegenticoccus tardaugens]